MPKVFDLAAMAPDRPTIRDLEGDVWALAVPGDFDLVTEATRLTLEKQMSEAERRLREDPSDIEAAQEVREMLAQILKIYIPQMPIERIRPIPENKKREILIFWGENCLPLFMAQAVKTHSPGIQMAPLRTLGKR